MSYFTNYGRPSMFGVCWIIQSTFEKICLFYFKMKGFERTDNRFIHNAQIKSTTPDAWQEKREYLGKQKMFKVCRVGFSNLMTVEPSPEVVKVFRCKRKAGFEQVVFYHCTANGCYTYECRVEMFSMCL